MTTEPDSAKVVESDTARKERLVAEACNAWTWNMWETLEDVEDFMREALGLPPSDFPGEQCESSQMMDPCSVVKHHDADGVPLCARCYADLVNEDGAYPEK